MALRIRRGTELERVTVVFAEGEIVYATDTKRLYVGDGVTAGGIAVADLLTDSSPQLGNTLDLNSHDIVGFGNINIQGDISATGTLTVPTIITDVQGSIFGDDSTPLVDGANNKLILNNNSIKDLQDVDNGITYLDQILKWNGTTWSSIDYKLGALANVNTAGVADQQIIWWDEQSSNWVPTDYYLGSLVDVDFTSGLATGKTIRYDQQVPAWLPIDFKLESLDDVDIPGVVSGDLLRYDGSKFVPYALSLSINDLDDVVIDPQSIILGDTLQWNGNEFIPAAPPQTITYLDDLVDTVFSNLQVGETIIWDGANWINTAGPGDILQTHLQGSVYGLDSAVLVDAEQSLIVGDVNNTVVTTKSFNIIWADGEQDNNVLQYTKQYASEVTNFQFLHSQQFRYNDPVNGNINVNEITSTTSGFLIFTGGTPTEPIFDENGPVTEKLIHLNRGRIGIQKSPTCALDVSGDVKVTGFTQFGSYTTAERDDLTTTNNPQYATNFGMVIYNTTTNTFQGWQNTGGTTPEWVNLS